jgi:hypothetical protein
LQNFRARFYDEDLFRFYAMDPAGQQLSPYAFSGNSPMIFVDRNGKWFFTGLLGPVGAIIDAGLWSATINAGVQTAMIAAGMQQGFNGLSLIGSFVGGAVGGAFALAAPSFSAFGGQGFLTSKYLAKAGYSALSAGTSATVGMAVTDVLDDGKLNFKGKDYLKAFGLGAGIAGAISIGVSMYDYATWDRFSYSERMNMINNEFKDLNASFDDELDPNQTRAKTNANGTKFSKSGLESNEIAKTTARHELRHISDQKLYDALGQSPKSGVEFTDSPDKIKQKLTMFRSQQENFRNSIMEPQRSSARIRRFPVQ